MENRTKKRKRMVALLLLFLTFILFITTTYAWFSTNRVVGIDTLNVHVQADGGLEVSTDAVNFKQVITVQDIMDARDNYPNAVNQVPYRMYPVSSGGSIDGNGYLEMFSGEATNARGTDFILVANKSLESNSFGEESEGRFIVFDLFFRTTNNKELYLSGNSSVTYNGDSSSGIENATRVAFLNEGVSSDNAGTAQGLNGASEALIWEPNYDVHTEYGVKNAKDVYGIDTTMTGGALLPYDGVINNISSNDNVLITDASSNRYPNFFRRVNVSFNTVAGNTSNTKILDLEPSITKVRIYMWIEGQDVDCEDNASYGDISFNLEFTTNPS